MSKFKPYPTHNLEKQLDWWFPYAAIVLIYNHYEGDHDKVLDAVAKTFRWTIGQAYIATEFLYRPENYN